MSETPFREKLEPSRLAQDYAGRKFKTLPGLRGKKIIREEELLDSKHAAGGEGWMFGEYKEGYVELQKLRKDYGINVANVDLVVGKGEDGRKKMFMVVDDIQGTELNGLAVQNLSAENIAAMDSFFERVLQYLLDAYQGRKQFLWDLGREGQYVYGHKAGEGEDKNRLYLVDVEPRLEKSGDKSYHDMFAAAVRDFQYRNRNLKPGHFPKFHAKLEEIKDFLDQEEVKK